VLAIAAASALALAGPAAAERYVVLYPQHGSAVWGAKHDVKKAGGSIVAAYPQIDVVIAESSDPNFAQALDRNRDVEGVAAVGSVVASPPGRSARPSRTRAPASTVCHLPRRCGTSGPKRSPRIPRSSG